MYILKTGNYLSYLFFFSFWSLLLALSCMNEQSYKNKAGDGNTSLEISFYYIYLKYRILNLVG